MFGSLASRDAVAHERAAPNRFLAAAYMLVRSVADGVAAARAYRELGRLSDRELAARGLTRATLMQHINETYLGR